jgi:hypothetical protein
VRPNLEKTHHKKGRDGAGVVGSTVAQGIGPEFKPQYQKKNQREWKGRTQPNVYFKELGRQKNKLIPKLAKGRNVDKHRNK